MNKILILLLSCAFCGIASAGSLFGSSYRHGLFGQNMRQNQMSSLQSMSQKDLMRQKFVLDILMNLQQRLDDTKMLKEYDINEIGSITRDMCDVEMDEQMVYMMELCNRCLRTNLADLYSLSNMEQMRQVVGLYRILITARDWETVQQIAILARKCVNGPVFAYSFMMAIRDREDTKMIIIPRMYEVLPDIYLPEEDMEQIQMDLRNSDNIYDRRVGNMPMNFLDKSDLWMPFREMRRQIMIQKLRGKLGQMPMAIDTNQNIKVIHMQNDRQRVNTMDLLLEDLDLKAYVDSLLFDIMLVMNQRQSIQDGIRNRVQIGNQDQMLKEHNEMRMRGYMQDEINRRQEFPSNERFGYRTIMLDNDIIDRRQNYVNEMHSMNNRDIMGGRQNEIYEMDAINDRNLISYRENEMNINNRDKMGRRQNQMNTINSPDVIRRYENENRIVNQLPTRDVNDDRLLHVGRRYMNIQNDQSRNIDNQRNAEMNEAWKNFLMDRMVDLSQGRSVKMDDLLAFAAANPRGLENIDNDEGMYDRRRGQSYSEILKQQYENNMRQMSGRLEGNQRIRQRRSAELMSDNRNQEGFVLLHNIRQLLARVNLECKSLGENDCLMSTMRRMEMNNRGIDRGLGMRLNQMRLNTQQSHLLMEHLNELEKLINVAIEREIEMQKVDRMEELDIERVVLNVIIGRVQGVSIIQMLDDLQQRMRQQNSDQGISVMKREIQIPIIMHFLARMNQILSMQQQHYGYRYKLDDLLMPSVTIQDVKVDKLRTYIDSRDDDLLNKMNCQNIEQCLQMKQMVFARQPRLNHKSFAIKLDLISDRDQNVIMRTFLASKDQIVPADLMLLDTNVVQLRKGHNSIKRKSNEIIWTLKETTSYSQLYQQVMRALRNEEVLMRQNTLIQNCQFPHNLLLPRGRLNGLPMKLVVVLSPMDDSEMQSGRRSMICAMGLGNMNLDRRSLGFPMDRYIKDIDNIEQLMSLSNIYVTDVSIYHDD